MKTAAKNIRKPTTQTSLRRWWVEKYKLPWTHESAQNSTLDELLVEYYEDLFEKNPSAARKALSDSSGEFFFEDDEDPLIQKWENELKRGLIPDLEEGLSQDEKAKLRSERAHTKRARAAESALSDENYDDPRYASKYQREAPQNAGLSGRLLGSAEREPQTENEWDDFLAGAGIE